MQYTSKNAAHTSEGLFNAAFGGTHFDFLAATSTKGHPAPPSLGLPQPVPGWPGSPAMPTVTQDLLGRSGQPPPTLCGRGPGGGAASGARGAPSSRGASPASRGACRPREPRRPWDEGPAQWRPPPSAAVCWFPFVARVQLEGAAQARACSLFLAAPPCEQGRCAQAGPQGAASRISVRGAGFSAS